jgi:hypothetical protein
MTLTDRLLAAQERSEPVTRLQYDGSHYHTGRYACGCDWDSGPVDLPCEAHNVERLRDDVLRELTEAARAVLGFRPNDWRSIARLLDAVMAAETLISKSFNPGPRA